MSKKISQLTEVTNNTSSDVFVCNQSGDTKKTTLQKIADFIFGTLSGADIPIGTSADPSTIAGAVGVVSDISANVQKTSIVNDFEKSVVQNNKLVSFYVGFSINTAPSGVGGIATGFPIPKTLKQIPLVCVSGTNKGKAARCAIDLNGNLINYYSDTSIWNVGDVYIVNACYLTA